MGFTRSLTGHIRHLANWIYLNFWRTSKTKLYIYSYENLTVIKANSIIFFHDAFIHSYWTTYTDILSYIHIESEWMAHAMHSVFNVSTQWQSNFRIFVAIKSFCMILTISTHFLFFLYEKFVEFVSSLLTLTYSFYFLPYYSANINYICIYRERQR